MHLISCSKHVVGALLLAAAPAGFGQLTDPLPEPLPSGLAVEVEPWLTIPASSGSVPRARINHIKTTPGEDRLFCNDLRGKLWVIANRDAVEATLFLDLPQHFPHFIDSPGLGTGFASFDFHPEFNQPGMPGYGKFYTAHTESNNGPPADFAGPVSPGISQIGVITEWTMDDPAANAIVHGSGTFTHRELMRVAFPYFFHCLQEIAFNPHAVPEDEDYGLLFICVGDGGSIVIDRPENHGRIDSVLGTILRIAPVLAQGHDEEDFVPSANGHYFIPAGETNANPFVEAADPTPGDGFPVVREIYAYGFRNPHRISWDAGGEGAMFCGNIGERQVEEIERVEKGGHYGWPAREGSFLFLPTDKDRVYPLPVPDTSPPHSPPEPASYTYPVTQYDHKNGRSAVVGGYVYRGTAIPDLVGQYLLGDIVTGELFIAEAAAMQLATTTTTGSQPAPPRTLGVKLNGNPTSFRSIVGASRIDLRFGIDPQGELYLLSKQNGMIYRLKADSDTEGGGAPEGTVDDWTSVEDFENGLPPELVLSVPGSSAQVVNDPLEGPSNRVLRVRSAGSTILNAHLPIPEIADDSHGTLFFRFMVPNQNHDYNWGLSEQVNPSTYDHFKVQLRSNEHSGLIETRDGGGFNAAFPLQTHTWYSVWLHIHNASGTGADNFNIYVQGGEFGTPTLVRTGVRFRNGIADSLRTFFWRVRESGEIYFDDIHVDTGTANLTEPIEREWRKGEDFESADPLAAWESHALGTGDALVEVNTEANGDRALRHAAAQGEAVSVLARRLPFLTQVSQSVTLRFRMRLESTDLEHHLGLSSANHSDPALYSEADFEPQLRLRPADGGGAWLELFDGPAGSETFIPATVDGVPLPPLEAGVRYDVWIVADNAGFASGGQTWKAYLRGGGLTRPTPLGGTLFFRRQAEAPITHFLTIARSGVEAGNGVLQLDDIYAFPGENIGDPLAATPLPGSIDLDGEMIELTFLTPPNRRIDLLRSEDLVTWQPLGEPFDGDGWPVAISMMREGQRGFFRAAARSRRVFAEDEWTLALPGGPLPDELEILPSSTWTHDPGLLTLTATGEQIDGMVSRPAGYALAPGDWRNATLTVEARTLQPASVINRDVVLIFGYVDETHFYYAHLSSNSDGTFHTVIMLVDGDTRTTIHNPLIVDPAPLGSDWHMLRVTHCATGEISVFVDDMENPVMTANDLRYPVGRMGFGSFDDPAEFRGADITGERR